MYISWSYLRDTGVDIHAMLVSSVGIRYGFTPGSYVAIKNSFRAFINTV